MDKQASIPSVSPFFSHFLKPHMFVTLFALAISTIAVGVASTYVIGNSEFLPSNILGLIIASFLAPAMYLFVKSFFATYGQLFNPSTQKLLNLGDNISQDEEFAYLFSS